MDFQSLQQSLKTVEEQQRGEVERRDARIEELSKALVGKQEELERSQELAERERLAKEKAKDQLEVFEAEFVKTRTNVAARIATLEAEQEVIARRDRESRNELDRLRHMKLEHK